MHTRTLYLPLGTLWTLIVGLLLAAGVHPVAAADRINTTRLGKVAIKGYDPVAYFDAGQPTKGLRDFEYEWHGASWRFASAEHRDRFRGAPERYAPQYGGFCAWAVSEGYVADINPKAWKIVGGKLYLNFSLKIQAKWVLDLERHIQRADRNWVELRQTD